MINVGLSDTIISLNTFMGLPYNYKELKILMPLEHPYNGCYLIKGIVGQMRVQTFSVGIRKQGISWAVQYFGVPTIPDGYIHIFQEHEEQEVKNLIGHDIANIKKVVYSDV